MPVVNCSSSSHLTQSYICDNAYDGNDGTYWHSSSGGKLEWITLDLAKDYHLEAIKILEGTTYRSQNISVEFSDGTKTQQVLEDSTCKWKKIQLPPKLVTSFVNITTISGYGSPSYRTLYELRVFGCSPGGFTMQNIC